MTSTLTHPTLASLLEAVRAAPDDDTVRRALADYLEESGTDPAWAELIRVQVELARVGECDIPWNCGCDKCLLQCRQSALLAEHEPRWRRGEKCHECDGRGRGYVSNNAADIEMGRCFACHGTGWSRWWLAEENRKSITAPFWTTREGVYTEERWRYRVHFERGLITQVDANLADIFDGERATPWALACVRGEPGLRRFGVVDRKPYDFDVDDGMRYGWHPADNYQVDEPDHIPRKLFDMIFKRVKEWEEATYFDSPAAANRALATAAYQRVREQA